MLHIIKWILRFFGVRVATRPHLTSVSKSITVLRYWQVPKKRIWFFGGLAFGITVFGALAWLYHARGNWATHGAGPWWALYLAMSWSIVGPALIARYEMYTRPIFLKKCRRIIPLTSDFTRIRQLANSSLYTSIPSKFISLIWIVVVAIGFMYSSEFVNAYGLDGFNDWLYWFLFAGVIIFAFYSSIGFCLTYRAYELAQLVSKATLSDSIFHHDRTLGLSFVGEFAFKTIAIFSSGWLFGPLVVMIGYDGGGGYLVVPIVLLGIYFLTTVFAFFSLVYSVHLKLISEKKRLMSAYLDMADKSVELSRGSWSELENKKLQYAKEVIADIRSISEWPLKLGVAVKVATSSLLAPALSAAISIAIKSRPP